MDETSVSAFVQSTLPYLLVGRALRMLQFFNVLFTNKQYRIC